MPQDSGIRCPRCHAPVLAEITDAGVVTVDGEEVPFKRHTDFVMCTCLATWRVADLRDAWAHVEASTRS